MGIFHLLVHSPKGHNSQGQAHLEAWNRNQEFYPGTHVVAGTPALTPSPTAFQVHPQEAGLERQQPGLELVSSMKCQQFKQCTLHYDADPHNGRLLLITSSLSALPKEI